MGHKAHSGKARLNGQGTGGKGRARGRGPGEGSSVPQSGPLPHTCPHATHTHTCEFLAWLMSLASCLPLCLLLPLGTGVPSPEDPRAGGQSPHPPLTILGLCRQPSPNPSPLCQPRWLMQTPLWAFACCPPGPSSGVPPLHIRSKGSAFPGPPQQSSALPHVCSWLATSVCVRLSGGLGGGLAGWWCPGPLVCIATEAQATRSKGHWALLMQTEGQREAPPCPAEPGHPGQRSGAGPSGVSELGSECAERGHPLEPLGPAQEPS